MSGIPMEEKSQTLCPSLSGSLFDDVGKPRKETSPTIRYHQLFPLEVMISKTKFLLTPVPRSGLG